MSAGGRAALAGKEAAYFGAPERPLFGFYHAPLRTTWRRAGVVLCNPIGTDMTRSDRTYRQLAERLAAAGFACLRFDLFGTGDSGGDEFSPGIVRQWIEDIGLAVDQLRALSGARAISLVGLRLGATLACAHASMRDDIDSLVLWSPCVTGSGFVADATRLHKTYLRMEPHLAMAPAAGVPGEEALGWFLPHDMLAGLAELDLLALPRRPAHRTLVIDGGGVAARDLLLERLRDLGAAPDLALHPGHKFLATVSHRSVVPTEVLNSIVAWLGDVHQTVETSGDSLPSAGPGPHAPCGERPFVIGGGHPLFGVLTPADPTKAAPGRPAIVMMNAGCVNRHGPHRMYVKMARRWAALGFDVLRMDMSGIGDSPAVPGTPENLTYPPTGLDDVRRALRSIGAARWIVAGLCSGGDYAFQLGARDANVVGAWLLNPRTFSVLELAAVESGAPPTAPVDEVPRTLREMAVRGVDTTLIVSRNDPGVAYVDEHARDAMRALDGAPHFRRVDLEGSDHSFTPVSMQQRVSDLLSEELVRIGR